MELKVNQIALPEQVFSFNYEELKAELQQRAKLYATTVYTEDQIKEAKADRAKLNALKKSLNDERLRREREYMEPFNTFKAQINEIIKIIDEPVAEIDKQVKEFEAMQKQKKLQAIQDEFMTYQWPKEITFEAVIDPKWTNASVSMKSIVEALDEKYAKMVEDLRTITKLKKYSFDARKAYMKSLNLNEALAVAAQLEQRDAEKAEYEAKRKQMAEIEAQEEAEKVTEEEAPQEAENRPKTGRWIAFEAYLDKDTAPMLGAFLKANGIEYRPIKK